MADFRFWEWTTPEEERKLRALDFERTAEESIQQANADLWARDAGQLLDQSRNQFGDMLGNLFSGVRSAVAEPVERVAETGQKAADQFGQWAGDRLDEARSKLPGYEEPAPTTTVRPSEAQESPGNTAVEDDGDPLLDAFNQYRQNKVTRPVAPPRPIPSDIPFPPTSTVPRDDWRQEWRPQLYQQTPNAETPWSGVDRGPVNPQLAELDESLRQGQQRMAGSPVNPNPNRSEYRGIYSDAGQFGGNALRTGETNRIGVNVRDTLVGAMRDYWRQDGKEPDTDQALSMIAGSLTETLAHEVAHDTTGEHDPIHQSITALLRRTEGSPTYQDIYDSLVAMRDRGDLRRAVDTAKAGTSPNPIETMISPPRMNSGPVAPMERSGADDSDPLLDAYNAHRGGLSDTNNVADATNNVAPPTVPESLTDQPRAIDQPTEPPADPWAAVGHAIKAAIQGISETGLAAGQATTEFLKPGGTLATAIDTNPIIPLRQSREQWDRIGEIQKFALDNGYLDGTLDPRFEQDHPELAAEASELNTMVAMNVSPAGPERGTGRLAEPVAEAAKAGVGRVGQAVREAFPASREALYGPQALGMNLDPTGGGEPRRVPSLRELVGDNPRVDPLAANWNEEAFFLSRPEPDPRSMSQPLLTDRSKRYGIGPEQTPGYNQFAASDDVDGSRSYLMHRFVDADGKPLMDWGAVGEYDGENIGIAEAYRGAGAGTEFVKWLISTGRYKGPSIGYSPGGLATITRAQRELANQPGPYGPQVAGMNPNPTVDLSAPQQPVEPFYSALQRTIEEKMPNRANPAQVQGILRGSAVKPDEMIWTGFDDWLAEQKGPITKQQALDFLEQNQVRVEEVVKGNRPRPEVPPLTIRETEHQWVAVDDRGLEWGSVGKGTVDSREAATEYLNRYIREREAEAVAREGGGPNAPKFGTSVLPGGENYRELLITLPDRTRSANDTFFGYVEGLKAKYGDSYWRDAAPDELAEMNRLRDLQQGTSKETYRSPHWDEPNILAHVRFNERTAADGKRVLFVEEVQSDWHQAGREKGYLPSDEARQQAVLTKVELQQKWDRDGFLSAEDSRRIIDAQAIVDAGRNGAIPAAPFQKTWPELAMKRVIRWAAENDFDRVAWTTGEQQAARYDLAKHVQNIEWRALSEDAPLGTLVAHDHGGREVIHEQIPPAKVADYIGREPAEKLLGQTSQPMLVYRRDGGQTTGVQKQLSGIDLTIGGSGMKSFYDSILANVANKLGKRFGARVGETEIATKARIGQDVAIDQVTPNNWQVIDRADPEGMPLGDFGSRREAEQFIATLGGNERVHALDITPSMKQSVLYEGQPLFANPNPTIGNLATRAGTGAAAGGTSVLYAPPTDEQGNPLDPSDPRYQDEVRRRMALGAGAGLASTLMPQLGRPVAGNIIQYGPAGQKVAASIAPPARAVADLGKLPGETVRQLFDNAVGLRKLGEQVAGAVGRPLTLGEDAYKLLRLSRGSAAAAEQRLREGLEPVVKGLDDQGIHDLNVYLKAKDTIDKAAAVGNPNRNFGGMTAADAQQAINEMQTKLGQGFADLDAKAQQVWQFGHDLLDRKVQAGLVDPQLAADLKAKYPHYSPIKIIDWLEDNAGAVGGSPQRLSVAQNGLRRLTEEGTARTAETPLEAYVRLAYETERLTSKNVAAQAFIDYFKQDPSLAGLIKPANRAGAQFLGTGGPLGHRAPGEAEFSVFVSGEKHDFYIDKSIERAFNYTGWDLNNPVGWGFRMAANLLRAGATGLNVLFLLPNAVGDAVTYQVRNGGLVDLPKNLSYLSKGYLGAITKDADYAELQKLGGGMAGWFTGEANAGAKTVGDLRGAVNTPDQLWRWVRGIATFQPVREVGAMVETGTRLAQFKKDLAAGVDPQQAALNARDVTIDFLRAGEFTKALNAIVPFFNVGFQAPAQVVRMMQNPATRTRALLGVGTMVVGPTVALEVYNRKDPTYADVPQHDKDRGLIIMDPRGPGPVSPESGRPVPRYVLINMREWTPFAIAVREAMGRALGEDTRSWQDAAQAILRSTSPIEPGANAVFDVLPTPLKVGAELVSNYDSFRGQPIVPESLQHLPAEEQYTSRTSETAKAIGRAIGKPPVAVEHLVTGLGAGLGRQALAGADLALKATGRGTEPSRRMAQLQQELAKSGLPPDKRATLEHELQVEQAKQQARSTQIREQPIIGGLAGTVYREGGGELDRRAAERTDQRLQAAKRGVGAAGSEMKRLGVNMSDVSGDIAGQRLNRAQAQQYRDRALDYRQRLVDQLVTQPVYQQADDASKTRLLRSALGRAGGWASQTLEPRRDAEGYEFLTSKIAKNPATAITGYLRAVALDEQLRQAGARRFLGVSGDAAVALAGDVRELNALKRALGRWEGEDAFIRQYGVRRFNRADSAEVDPRYEALKDRVENNPTWQFFFGPRVAVAATVR